MTSRHCQHICVAILLLWVAARITAKADAPLPLSAVPISQVTIHDPFWSPKLEIWRNVTLPDCLNKFETDHGGAFNNFDRVRDGKQGGHAGPPWYDGLIYQMIRAGADFLIQQPDSKLQARLDGYITRIAAAADRDPNGYINTWTELMEPTHRWGANGGNDLWQHDLYNAGALIDAGVHYYRATGKTTLLAVAVRMANHMADIMGPAPRQNLVPGHELGEEALVNLYLLFEQQPDLKAKLPMAVDQKRFLDLAMFWIESRGHHEGRRDFGSYAQDQKPVLEQETIEGHSVRATLLCAGLTAAGVTAHRPDYLAQAQRFWDDMVHRRMYITGGLGAVAGYEGFAPDYVLPNEGYLETCAAVGAGFFHENLCLASGDGRCADELERVLYNGVLSGVSLKGDTYFYENPLLVPDHHTRWAWHACPCCPPMFLKIMAALPGYLYAQDPAGNVFVNLYVGSDARLQIAKSPIQLTVNTRYPWEPEVQLKVTTDQPIDFTLNLRIPAWCRGATIQVNGKSVEAAPGETGYAAVHRTWSSGDTVDLVLPMDVQRIKADPRVTADIGRVALQRGPVVYCVEAVDHNGHVLNLLLPANAPLSAEHRDDLLGGVTVIRANAIAMPTPAGNGVLYQRSALDPAADAIAMTAIPYYANSNRGAGEMEVWIADTPDTAHVATAGAAKAAAPLISVKVTIDPSQALKPVSPWLTGACLEDVNHEVYGGLYSQMIFGESFAEPAIDKIAHLTSLGGGWTVHGDELTAAASDGGKLMLENEKPVRQAGVQIRFDHRHAGNAGLVFDGTDAQTGADAFTGYEISLDPDRQQLRLGRHQQNFQLLRDVPCSLPMGQWIDLSVNRDGAKLQIQIDGKAVLTFDQADLPETAGAGLRTWQRAARFRRLWVSDGNTRHDVTIEADPHRRTSGMWQVVSDPGAVGETHLVDGDPFVGKQSQQIVFVSGTGHFGIVNRGLNHQGMTFLARHDYRGHLWARAATAVDLTVAMAGKETTASLAAQELHIGDPAWRRYDFTLTPNTDEPDGGFALLLQAPGTVDVGYVFLEPGDWGTFKHLPVRNDVAQMLQSTGITAMRYGGSMVNAPEYRWKKMIGDRDHRPPYRGTWYGQSSNGWGIIDFLNVAEAMGVLPVPDFNIDESPADMVDFLEYANGGSDTPWGSKRAADGHPAPYRLTHLELGNEERVDDAYYEKFAGIAKAIWAKDPNIILTVGDFSYHQPIRDPMHFSGADSRITSLEAHQKILALARQCNATVWFDIHIWTEKPASNGWTDPFATYIDAIDKLADGARHQVVCFELNANRHDQDRALANAQALLALQPDGRMPFVSSANCLQVDGQNDNGWDQGLVFLNPQKAWLQPPGYAWQLLSSAYQPVGVMCTADAGTKGLEFFAAASEDRKTITLEAINLNDAPAEATTNVAGNVSANCVCSVSTLAGEPGDQNSADADDKVKPVSAVGLPAVKSRTLPAHSLTVIQWKSAS